MCGHCWSMLMNAGAVTVSAIMARAGLVKFPVGFVMARVWAGHGWRGRWRCRGGLNINDSALTQEALPSLHI